MPYDSRCEILALIQQITISVMFYYPHWVMAHEHLRGRYNPYYSYSHKVLLIKC